MRSVDGMTAKDDLRDFLATRRAKLTPQQAGLPVVGANRRVAGLRREGVSLLAGISVEYYTRLERGNVGGVSDSVLDGICHALQLDDAERDHLHRLVRAVATRPPSRRTPAIKRVRPTIQRVLDLMPTPAYLRNGRFDILATNDLGRALYSPRTRNRTPPTPPASPSSTPPPPSSFSTSTRSRTTPSPSFAPKPDGTRTTRTSRTSSENSPPAASASGNDGLPTTCGTTAAASSASTTRSSVTSPSTSRPSNSPGTRASASTSTARHRRLPPRKHSPSSPAGRSPQPISQEVTDGGKPAGSRGQETREGPARRTGQGL